MPTARVSRHRRGQVLPILAFGLSAFMMLSALLIDGALLLQAQRDLNIIAYHSARTGANRIVVGCQPAPGAACALDQGSARAAAASQASQWMDQTNNNFGLAGSNESTVVSFPSGTTIRVTLGRCYRLAIFSFMSNAGCSSGIRVGASADANALAGN